MFMISYSSGAATFSFTALVLLLIFTDDDKRSKSYRKYLGCLVVLLSVFRKKNFFSSFLHLLWRFCRHLRTDLSIQQGSGLLGLTTFENNERISVFRMSIKSVVIGTVRCRNEQLHFRRLSSCLLHKLLHPILPVSTIEEVWVFIEQDILNEPLVPGSAFGRSMVYLSRMEKKRSLHNCRSLFAKCHLRAALLLSACGDCFWGKARHL